MPTAEVVKQIVRINHGGAVLLLSVGIIDAALQTIGLQLGQVFVSRPFTEGPDCCLSQVAQQGQALVGEELHLRHHLQASAPSGKILQCRKIAI